MYADLVLLSGVIQGGAWTQLAKLPAEAAPLRRVILSACNGDTVTRVDITPDGARALAAPWPGRVLQAWLLRICAGWISYQGGGQNYGWVSLEGLMFSRHGGMPLELKNGWDNFGQDFRTARRHRVRRARELGVLRVGTCAVWWREGGVVLPACARSAAR